VEYFSVRVTIVGPRPFIFRIFVLSFFVKLFISLHDVASMFHRSLDRGVPNNACNTFKGDAFGYLA
jgi:hypothetical protein